jgi:hypothetical protein
MRPDHRQRHSTFIPQDAPLGVGTLTVVTPSGAQSTATVNVKSLAPGIFAGGVVRLTAHGQQRAVLRRQLLNQRFQPSLLLFRRRLQIN